MTIFKKIFFFIFGVLFSQFLFSDNVIIEHYTVDDGLLHENINCIVKSSDGFIWLGTWHGLCSFDGKEMKSYNSSNRFQLDVPPRKIQDILEDSFGNLWLKTIDHKIYVFDKKHERFHSILKYLNKDISVNSQIIKISATENGSFLLLTKDKDLLLAIPQPNAVPEIKLLYKSDNKSFDSKLRKNILKENNEALNWIGMDFSIYSLDKSHWKNNESSTFITDKLNKDECSSVFDGTDYIWIGCHNGLVYGVNKFTGETREYDGLRDRGAIQQISSKNDSLLYVNLKDKGIYSISITNNDIDLLNVNSSDIIHTEYDEYGLIWFLTDNDKVILYDTNSNNAKTYEFPILLPLNNRMIMQNGGETGMFFLTVSGQLYHYDRSRKEIVYLLKDSKYHSNEMGKFSDILFDENGTLWLSSYDDGLFQINFPNNNFKLINPVYDSSFMIGSANNSSIIKALFQDNNGDIWMSNRSSEVYRLSVNGITKNKFSAKNFNIGNVYHIMQDDEGTMWFSTKGQGLVSAKFDSNSELGFQFKRFLHDPDNTNSITSNDVYFSYQDTKGRMWVATFGGGLNLFQSNDTHSIFKHKINSFANYPDFGQYMEVRTIVEDKTGRIWVGTTDGLMSFDGDFKSANEVKFETYLNDFTVFNNDVYYLFRDKSDDVWVSIFGVGINRLKGYDHKRQQPVFETYGIRNGLNSDVVLTIKEDNSDNLWLSTERGISRLSKKSRLIRNFDKYDGLKDMSFVESSSLCLNDGNLWFGTLDGILSFCPDGIVNNNFDYPTYIVDVKVSNKDYDIWSNDSISVEYLDKIVLKHNQSMFSIEYAALNYSTQNHISYKYILEGFEKEWHEVGKNRVASFSNIPHGKYVFRVVTEDVTNPLLKSERSLQIQILPPWWKSNWAYFIYAILSIILSYVILRLTLLFIKMKNDVYIEHALSDLKLKFFTNVSHELRTPLTLIQVPIEELKEEENLSEKGRKYISMVEKNATHMVDLVNQILDFRKIENNKMRLKISLIDLNQVCRSLYNEFVILSDENEISFDFSSEEEIVLWADKDKLEIVIRNIISNAFKFTPIGGSILITTGKNSNNNTSYIRIDDSGVGIPENKIGDIFERYSQSNVLFKGTGIGLALSKELVTLHHGEIKVKSVQNEGSTFIVELPLGKEHFNEAEVDFYLSDIVYEPESDNEVDFALSSDCIEDKAIDNRERPVLMIVEDNKSLCNLLKLQLEDMYNIHIAHDGEEGFQKIHLYHPDIVITDQMMPKVGGLELLEQIREDFQVSHIPVIVLTAKNDDDARLKAFQLGANAYITKPFSKKHLIARIEQLLIERRKFRERLWSNEVETTQVSSYGEFLIQKDVEFLDEVHRIIEENMNNSDFNIDVIAESLNISRSSFFKKLKSITGLSPIDLVREVRLSKAVDLIKKTDMTVTEIAFAVGFKDPGYFGKCFRKKFNLNPRDYANEYRTTNN